MNWLEQIISKMTYETKGGKTKPMTQYKFAQMCGLSRSHIKNIIDNDIPIEKVFISTAEAISKALGLSLYELIESNKKKD